MSTLRTNNIESLDGQSLATVEDLSTINKRTIYVGSVAELEALSTTNGNQASLSGSKSGIFEFSSIDLSTQVSDDTNSDFFIAPATDVTGVSGAWVRQSGVVISNEFSQYAPEGSVLFSSIDDRIYIREGGQWNVSDDHTETSLNTHVQSVSEHGLREDTVAFGSLSAATGTRSIAIGYDAKSSSSIVIGRESNSLVSPFSVIVGAQAEVVNNLDDLNLRYNTIINGSNIVDSDGCIVLNSYGFVPAAIADSTKSLSLLSPGSGTPAVNYGDDCFALGGFIRGASSSRIDGAVTLGALTNANYSLSVAIGKGCSTTAPNQIRLGTASETTVIPGNLDVTGTKNFSIPHPVPGKEGTHTLYHASYEGPVPGGTIYRYSVETVSGQAVVNLPEYFKHLNKDEQVWCSPKKHFGQAYGEIADNTLTVTSNQDGAYEILIMATRNDAGVANWKGVEVENGNA